MAKTVIALFDDLGRARDAVDALHARGFDRSRIEIQPGDEFLRRSRLPPPEHARAGVWPAIKRFLDEIGATTPAPPAEESYRPIERDDVVVVLEASDDHADDAAALLDREGAVDIEERRAAAGESPRRASGFEPATSGRTPPGLGEVPRHGDVDERTLAGGSPGDVRRRARVYDTGGSAPH